jgi:hypothetical protein
MERRYVAIDGLAMATSQRPGADQAIQQRRGMSRGLTKEGINALDTALERHVERGDLPGLVALVARGADVHVAPSTPDDSTSAGLPPSSQSSYV